MTTLNQHIEAYLTYYLNLKNNPGFAVLLHGDWGCGKTWFIKQFTSNHKNDHRFLYVSLYGVTAHSEIEDQLFQQLHPVLSSKPMALTGKILKETIKRGLKLDLEMLSLPEYLKKTDDCVLIFDDLERAQFPITALLGYINSFVEHHGSKVIILANETELDAGKLQRTEHKSDYRRIKEKLIGKSFRVLHDIEAGFDSFVEQVGDQDTREFLIGHKLDIVRTFNSAGYNNLRHLHRGFLDFERFFSSLSETHKQLPGLLDDLLPFFLSFSFEIQAGKMSPSDIEGIMIKALEATVSKKETGQPGPEPIVKFFEKYNLSDTYNVILPESCWRSFFDMGFIPAIELSQGIEKTSHAQSQKAPTWMRLWHYSSLQDDEFARLLDELIDQWNQNTFIVRGEILHVSGLFLRFSEIGLIKKSTGETLNDCKEYIDKIAATGAWTDKHLEKPPRREGLDFDSYGSLGYSGSDLKEFQELSKYLKDKIEKAKADRLITAAKELLDTLITNPDKFARSVTLCNSEDQIYYNIPIFEHVSASDFAEQLFLLDNKNKRTIGIAIKDRYEILDISRRLQGELTFLRELKKLLEEAIAKRKGYLSGHILERTVLNNVTEAIRRLENVGE